MKLLLAAILAATLLFIVPAIPADAKVSSVLRLDPLPSNVAAGSTVTFSGSLSTTTGYALYDGIIYIKDNVRFGSDKTIMTLRTNYWGEFSGTWTAQTRSSGSWDFYAEFPGSSDADDSKSQQYSVRVSANSGSSGSSGSTQPSIQTTTLTLDRIPSSVTEGEAVTFTGRLTTNGQPLQNAVIYIKEDDPLTSDQTLKSVRTDSNGYFSVVWIADDGLVEDEFDIYAVFEGTSSYKSDRTLNQEMTVREQGHGESKPQQFYETVLRMNPIGSLLIPGNQVIFSGSLQTTVGDPVSGATILIKDDVFAGRDDTIMTLRTDSYGRFYGDWTARERSSGSWDFYAEFKGTSQLGDAKSISYSLDVKSPESVLVLDRIPSHGVVGDPITFTGRLTINGHPLPNAPVHIMEDDPGKPDEKLASGNTDSNGYYRIVWTVKAGLVEDDFDVYAKFDGYGSYPKARSTNQEMTVQDIAKAGGELVLDPIPRTAKRGELINFSGTLKLDGHSPQGAIVYIKDHDRFSKDELLATAYVDRFGDFSIDWSARNTEEFGDMDVYAVFEGNDKLERLTSCERGSITNWCKDPYKLSISGYVSPPKTYIPTGDEYMELYYSLELNRAPRVAIVPSPDSYDEVRKYIPVVQEGILMWTSALEKKYGGYWDVDFEVTSERDGFMDSKPDIVINLVTREDQKSCFVDYAGVARIYNKIGPIQTEVCAPDKKNPRSNQDIAATAGHEFIHAMGLGHTFNKPGDLMCSKENNIPTCGNSKTKLKTPSELNLQAVARLYDSDGYTSPNIPVKYKSKLLLDGTFLNNHVSSNPTLPDAALNYTTLHTHPTPPDYTPAQPTPPNAPTPTPQLPPATVTVCDDTYRSYDTDVSVSLKPGWYRWYTLCPEDTSNFSYRFSADETERGFMIYWLPPKTDVKDFIKNDIGSYYTCEKYGQLWLSKSGTCNVPPGSKLVLYNDGKEEFLVEGYFTTSGFRQANNPDPPKLPVPAAFVIGGTDPYSYVHRYISEPAFKAWFDEYYSEYDSIYHAVGLYEPVELAVPAPFVEAGSDPQSYVDRYNSEPSFKAWFDENYAGYDSIYHAVGLDEAVAGSLPKYGSQAAYCRGSYSDDFVEVDELLGPGRYVWWPLCSSYTDTYSYWFYADNIQDKFFMIWLPSETNVKDYAKADSKHYACEGSYEYLNFIDNACTVAPGSKLLLANNGTQAIAITGGIFR